MAGPTCTLADIVRQHGEEFRQQFPASRDQLRVLRAIEVCRTAALGGHVQQCGHCGFTETAYNSCRNRHCPQCQAAATRQWVQHRQDELLPVPYFHVVFTLPHRLAPLALQNPAIVYGLLLRISAEVLLETAADPQYLGARLGLVSVLHTWGQNLLHHPHVHIVVPGGGLSADHLRWVASRHPRFLVPVGVLSRRFRARFLAALEEACAAGQLQFHGALAALQDRKALRRFLVPLRRSPWVVYAKPPFGGPVQVLQYIGRYTHRIAISNQRLVRLENGQVTFQWKDYRSAQPESSRPMTVTATEFLRRFLLHALPAGFQRIRYYGLLANRGRALHLQLCRQLLAAPGASVLPASAQVRTLIPEPAVLSICPHCRAGILQRVQTLLPIRWPQRVDSS
jgi:Putative transposase/Transposase zinc-binding domain